MRLRAQALGLARAGCGPAGAAIRWRRRSPRKLAALPPGRGAHAVQHEALAGNHAGPQVGDRVRLDRGAFDAADRQPVERAGKDLVHPGQRLLAGEMADAVAGAYRAAHRAAQEDDDAIGNRHDDPERGDVSGYVAENPAGQPGRHRGGGRLAVRREIGDKTEQLVRARVGRAASGDQDNRVAKPAHQVIARLNAHSHGHGEFYPGRDFPGKRRTITQRLYGDTAIERAFDSMR